MKQWLLDIWEGDGLFLMPLRTPLAATGFTRHSLELLAGRAGKFGLVPVSGGGATARVTEEEKDAALEPGGPLAVALITGDFDLSGIGTVTHVEGSRVFGWGRWCAGLTSPPAGAAPAWAWSAANRFGVRR